MTKTFDLEELQNLAGFLKGYLEELDSKQAVVLGLYGDLGSGKTTFTQFLARAYGISDHIQSPTFLIEKKYTINEGSRFKNFIHIDAYRLDSANEILNLNWQEIISNPENLIIVEWPERINDVLPEDILVIKFRHLDEDHRELETKLLENLD